MQQALLLDTNYMALSIVPWKKAVKLMVKGKAEAVVGVNAVHNVNHANQTFQVPSIIRLLVKIPWRAHMGRVKFSRKNVAARDGWKCQYCGTKIGKGAGTIDHIVPKSHGGNTDYLNCVLCCKKCNNVKGNKTPIEAGMGLLKHPRKPTFFALYNHLLNDAPKEWAEYVIGLN